MPSEVAAADFRDVWPPGFRFHPTDEELVLYYLKRKIRRRKLKLDVICEVDVYKFDPEELPGLSMLKSGDRQWFFFSPRDRKYPNGSRSNRATRHGYWKATGKDRTITCNSRAVGIKKTLVFYKGRAPSGERTDWVMHEYVLEENELKSCQDAQDFYVLYKVFKKSGAGPKNGEQYGALFREEDWADDVVTELTELGNHNDQNNHVKQPNAVTSQVQCTWNDIEEFLKQTVDEPALVEPDINEFEFAAVPQVFGEGAQSTMTETSFGNAGDTDLCKMPSPFSQQNVEGTLDLAFSASSQLLLPDPYEVASAGLITLEQHVFEEDFLEMNDLLDQEISCDIGGEVIPQPAGGELTATSQWVGADGLSEFDLYYDADVLIRETGTIEQTTYAHSYPNLQASQLVNLDDLEWRQPSSAVNNVGSQQGTYDQTLHFPTLNEPIPLGDECGGNFSSYATGSNSNQIQNGKGVEGEDSWYTSALWSFVDSIPTTPASAAESALVNRAFERMSSFTRLRMNLKSTTASTVAEAAPRQSSGGRMKGFFLLSFMGALLAILFVLIGTFGRIMRPRDHVE